MLLHPGTESWRISRMSRPYVSGVSSSNPGSFLRSRASVRAYFLYTRTNTCLLTGLNLIQLTSLNMVVNRLEQTVHGLTEQTDLNNVVGTIMIVEWWNYKIEQWCYNNHELGCCIKSGFACSNIRKQPLSIRQAVAICWNTIE